MANNRLRPEGELRHSYSANNQNRLKADHSSASRNYNQLQSKAHDSRDSIGCPIPSNFDGRHDVKFTSMRHKTTGILFVIFGIGLVVGSTAVAVGLNETGASILMIILGIYLVIKGVRVYANDGWHGKNYSNGGSTKSSSIGILLLGFFLFIVGAGLSATIIAIPIMVVGMVLIVAGS